MFRNAPFSGNISVVKAFGDDPSFFGQFQHQGVRLRGHNGIDFALTIGTPIVAVQSGIVLQADHDADGFGNYVVLGHNWGQTLYANLSHTNVSVNQQVSAGQQIGFSGNTGNSSAPQLHFGMRVHPFSVDDGWAGYCDPMPYLERLSNGLGAMIGPHIIGGFDEQLMEKWQPRMILVMDPNPDEMQRLRTICPNAVIIGRVFVPDDELDRRIRGNPQAAAQWAHDKTMEHMNPYVDFWQITNEILQDENALPQLNLFEQYRMAHAESTGYRCAIFGFSVGNPDLPEDDRTAHWRHVYQAIERAEQNGHIIALHQYGAPDLQGPAGLSDWLIFRLEHQVLRRLPYKKVKFAVTEYGIDGMLQQTGPSGWKNFTDAENYATQLINASKYLERYSGRVLGYAIFTLGAFSPWQSYDIAGSVAEMLAERSSQGTWLEVSTNFSGIQIPQGDSVVSPAGAGKSSEIFGATPVTPPVTPPTTAPTTPSVPTVTRPVTGTTPSVITTDQVALRTSDAFSSLNTRIHGIQERGDYAAQGLTGDVVYMIRDVFTTRNGSWEPTGDALSVPQWARDDYLKPFGAADWFDDAGADHHLFGAVVGLDGQLMREQEIIFWSDGFDKLGDPNYDGYVSQRTKTGSGWTNLPMGPGSNFVPERGESGPWSWMPGGAMAEVFSGGGLPANHHISTLVVWEAVRISDLNTSGQITTPVTQPPPVVTPPVTTQPQPTTPVVTPPPPVVTPPPPVVTPTPSVTSVSRRVGDWAESLNVSVKSVAERSDQAQALAGANVVYVLKDLFTTRDGSWEQADKPGAAPEWAKEYLRPVGAPDYFDDAGGDHHLFAAVIGLDGAYIPRQGIKFWSDGFDKLGDPNYQGFVERDTKDKSGWINIPIGPGSNFVPERGESGPWCWAPVGAADVVCGGGLPANQHVSTFAVWQAVTRADYDASLGRSTPPAQPPTGQPPTGQPPTGQQPDQDKKIFMPIVSGGPAILRSATVADVAVLEPSNAVEEIPSDTELLQSELLQSESVQSESLQSELLQSELLQSEAEETFPVEEQADVILVSEESAAEDLSQAADAIPEPEMSREDFLRKAAWQRVGVEFDPNDVFAQYARQHNLGVPVTPEFLQEDYIVQGYQGAVVFMPRSAPDQVTHTEW